jgi:DNA-directed RNA polymerase subunit L
MEIKVIEESPKKLIFEVKGVGHSFCNALKDELNNDKHVEAAAYRVDHPLVGIPRLIVETDGESPRDVLASAAKRLMKLNEKAAELFKSELK